MDDEVLAFKFGAVIGESKAITKGISVLLLKDERVI